MKKGKNKKIANVLIIFSMGLSQNMYANTAIKEQKNYTGLWLIEDTEAIVKISICKQSICGRIIGFKNIKQDNKNVPKEKGTQELKKTVCSNDLLGGFKKTSKGWKKGWIVDFENKQKYSASLYSINFHTLKLRAYKGIEVFGETLLWKRINKADATCDSILKGKT